MGDRKAIDMYRQEPYVDCTSIYPQPLSRVLAQHPLDASLAQCEHHASWSRTSTSAHCAPMLFVGLLARVPYQKDLGSFCMPFPLCTPKQMVSREYYEISSGGAAGQVGYWNIPFPGSREQARAVAFC